MGDGPGSGTNPTSAEAQAMARGLGFGRGRLAPACHRATRSPRAGATTTQIAEIREISDSSVTVVLDDPGEGEADHRQHRRAAADDAARAGGQPEHARAQALSVPPARPAPARQPRTPAARSLEPERDIDADQQRRSRTNRTTSAAVHREPPLRLAVRPIGGEPEERDPPQEIELVRPGRRERPGTRAAA